VKYWYILKILKALQGAWSQSTKPLHKLVASVSWDISSDFLNQASHSTNTVIIFECICIFDKSIKQWLISPLWAANFDSYGNVSFDPCEFTLHTAANAENNDCSKKLVCFLQHMNMCQKNGDHSTSVNVDLFQSCFQIFKQKQIILY
jgi:hypothetical protein